MVQAMLRTCQTHGIAATVARTGDADAGAVLVKQGHRSAVCQLDLTGIEDFITVLSGTTDNVALLDEIRAQVGDEPQAWLPLLIRKVNERRSLSKGRQP